MADTVIFIDGEYARKIFINTGYKLNIPKLIDMGVDLLGPLCILLKSAR